MIDSASAVDRADRDALLRSVFRANGITQIPPQSDRRQALHRLVASLAQTGRLRACDVQEILEKLLEREEYGTTALGKGLAFPHLRTKIVDSFAGAIGVAPTGVDFCSLDGLPTRLILLLLSPFEARRGHSEFLARLATRLSDTTLQYSLQIPRSHEAVFHFLGL